MSGRSLIVREKFIKMLMDKLEEAGEVPELICDSI